MKDFIKGTLDNNKESTCSQHDRNENGITEDINNGEEGAPTKKNRKLAHYLDPNKVVTTAALQALCAAKKNLMQLVNTHPAESNKNTMSHLQSAEGQRNF